MLQALALRLLVVATFTFICSTSDPRRNAPHALYPETDRRDATDDYSSTMSKVEFRAGKSRPNVLIRAQTIGVVRYPTMRLKVGELKCTARRHRHCRSPTYIRPSSRGGHLSPPMVSLLINFASRQGVGLTKTAFFPHRTLQYLSKGRRLSACALITGRNNSPNVLSQVQQRVARLQYPASGVDHDYA